MPAKPAHVLLKAKSRHPIITRLIMSIFCGWFGLVSDKASEFPVNKSPWKKTSQARRKNQIAKIP